jgi:hypothetical protein
MINNFLYQMNFSFVERPTITDYYHDNNGNYLTIYYPSLKENNKITLNIFYIDGSTTKELKFKSINYFSSYLYKQYNQFWKTGKCELNNGIH